MAASIKENPALIDQFVAVTGATRSVAVSMLEACAGNLDLAVGMHMDGQAAVGPSSSVQGDTSVASGAGPAHQEDYDDEVRAPIPQKTEVLVDDDDDNKFASWRMRRPRRMVRSVFDGFRDFQAEAKNYEDGIHGKSAAKKRNLEDLFRPPVDITHKGTFQSARDLGSSNNQWVLVNVQNVQEFECQVLNRDVWSCQAAKNLVTKNFVFWQVYNDSAEGKRFMQFYKVSGWPYVAIVDPFTGENQISWQKIPDGKTFCELVNEFLAMQPTPSKGESESPPNKRQKREASIVDASEQDQMEAAILASLEDNKAKASKSPLYVIDSDSEPDLIEDSDDDVNTFSDSDSVLESTPTRSESRQTKSTNGCFSSTSSSSPSSQFSSKLKSNQTVFNNDSSSNITSHKHSHKDSYSKCKNLSTSKKTTCSYTPSVHSNSSREKCSESSNSNSVDNSIGVCKNSLCSDRVSARDNGSCASNNSSRDSQTTENAVGTNSLDWKQFWGQETDPTSKIMMRFPDGRREQLELPCTSSLKALKTYCASLGFTEDKYELLTNFPRRRLSDLDDAKVLKDVGLYPQDTVFIQEL